MSSRNFHIAMHLAGVEINLPNLPPTQSNMVMMAQLPSQPGDPVMLDWAPMQGGSGAGGAGGGTPTAYGSVAPTTANQGDLWFDTGDKKLKTYDGTIWIDVVDLAGYLPTDGSGQMTGPLKMGTQKIVNAGDIEAQASHSALEGFQVDSGRY